MSGGWCTCGGSSPRLGHYDVTGFCKQERHAACSGRLYSATGFHWWCACTCHPEPEPSDTARVAHNEAALKVWRAARAALTAAQPGDGGDAAAGEA